MAKKKTAKSTTKKVITKSSDQPGNLDLDTEIEKEYGPRNQQVGDRFARTTMPEQLNDQKYWAKFGMPESNLTRGYFICELNITHIDGLAGAAQAFVDLYLQVVKSKKNVKASSKRRPIGMPPAKLDPYAVEYSPPVKISRTYFRCALSLVECHKLIAEDERRANEIVGKSNNGRPPRYRAIYKIWPDFPIRAHVDRSVATVKADAALKSFTASGDGIVWAVIDSGINEDHPHFNSPNNGNNLAVGDESLHRCFAPIVELIDGVPVERGYLPLPEDLKGDEKTKAIEDHKKNALTDDFGHGTHVAGIIAGRAPTNEQIEVIALEREDRVNEDGEKLTRQFSTRKTDRDRLRGVAPNSKLISLRVLDEKGEGRVSDVIRALDFIRERVNENPKMMRVHGVNLSVGYEFDAEMFACGQSPLCSEVDRLVQSGVVVVAAAGNTGYGSVASSVRASKVGLSNTINDPGNAAFAITVGSTHRDMPHTYGVSFFSSKGPTGDGRLKPDLVAPGERITSCAAGTMLMTAGVTVEDGKKADTAYYVDDSGTSMAAPHVSGAIAAFLSIRREFIGKPLEVKRIFLESATPLGRERYFEGHGLIDLMRAIQSV